MKDAILRLARHRLERAREALRDAHLLLVLGSLTSAINRFYYAAFYAARALLATREVDSSRHSGVITLFQKHFVKSGVVDVETAKAFPRAFEKRQTPPRLHWRFSLTLNLSKGVRTVFRQPVR